MKITVEKQLNWEDVHGLCVRQNYYTCGDRQDYEAMLDKVNIEGPTTQLVYEVAKDIVDHSNLSAYGQTYTENIESVMYLVAKEIRTFYHINEE